LACLYCICLINQKSFSYMKHSDIYTDSIPTMHFYEITRWCTFITHKHLHATVIKSLALKLVRKLPRIMNMNMNIIEHCVPSQAAISYFCVWLLRLLMKNQQSLPLFSRLHHIQKLITNSLNYNHDTGINYTSKYLVSQDLYLLSLLLFINNVS